MKEKEMRPKECYKPEGHTISWCVYYQESYSGCDCSYAKQRRQIKDSSKLQKILSGGEV